MMKLSSGIHLATERGRDFAFNKMEKPHRRLHHRACRITSDVFPDSAIAPFDAARNTLKYAVAGGFTRSVADKTQNHAGMRCAANQVCFCFALAALDNTGSAA
jgi:hypothetical protein